MMLYQLQLLFCTDNVVVTLKMKLSNKLFYMNAALTGSDLCGAKTSLITRDEKGDVSGVTEGNFWALSSLQRFTAFVPLRNFSLNMFLRKSGQLPQFSSSAFLCN
jgi:hypothetical protein